MNYYRIAESTMQNIADEVRKKRLFKGKYNAVDIPAEIAKIQTPIPIKITNHIGADGEWHRPDGWADLDSLDISSQVLYLSYDNVRDDVAKFLSLRANVEPVTVGWDIEIGTVENGEFTAYETAHVANNTDYGRLFTDSDPDYPVVRITSTGNISAVDLTPYPTSNAERPRFAEGGLQPCVERVGYLPYAKRFGGSTTITSVMNWRAYYLEREKLNVGEKVKDLSYAWSSCYSLQSLDIGSWNVGNVTNLNNTSFANLRRLILIKLPYNWNFTVMLNASTLYTRSCLLEMIDRLPTVSKATTLTLGTTNTAKLTLDEIAVATAKGWTIA